MLFEQMLNTPESSSSSFNRAKSSVCESSFYSSQINKNLYDELNESLRSNIFTNVTCTSSNVGDNSSTFFSSTSANESFRIRSIYESLDNYYKQCEKNFL